MTINNGTVATNEDIPARSAISLWQNIEAEADWALRSVKSSATLRFGHDTALYRLLSLLFDVNVPPAGAREEASLVVWEMKWKDGSHSSDGCQSPDDIL